MTKVLRMGLVGLGKISSQHIDSMRDLPDDFELVAAADLHPRDLGDITVYNDYHHLLEREDIDAIAIATPPGSHAVIAIDALCAGKHVLLEKPPAPSVEECDEMAKIADLTGKVLFMGFHASYAWPAHLLRQELAGKAVTEVHATYKEDVAKWHPNTSWVFRRDVGGGGVLIDSGINALSIMRYVLSPDRFELKSAELSVPPGKEVETKATIHFSLGDNCPGCLSLDWEWLGEEVRAIVFHTQEDEYVIELGPRHLKKNGEVIGQTPSDYYPYKGMYQDFARHVRERKSFVSTSELALIQEVYTRYLPDSTA